MTRCVNCGYERQPKDEGIIPSTECPQCGIIYAKATLRVREDSPAGSLLSDATTKKQESIEPGTFWRRIIPVVIFIVFLFVGIQKFQEMRNAISDNWHKNASGLDEAYGEQRSTGKPILVLFTIPS